MAQFISPFDDLRDGGGETFITSRHSFSVICFWNITFGAQPTVGFCCRWRLYFPPPQLLSILFCPATALAVMLHQVFVGNRLMGFSW